jgi:Icc-related predicted phosphoesterase
MPTLLIFSDIHNDMKALEKLMDIDADYYFCAGDLVSWGRGLDAMAKIMERRAERMHVMPGNHETEREIADLCERHGFVNFHHRSVEIGGVHVAGLGYSSPTPFDTPGEYSEAEIARRLGRFSEMNPLVLICHAPPLDTRLDRVHDGLHAGSSAVRDFIEKHHPRDFFCGHIHEAEGAVQQFGPTRGMNVGKRGYLLEL